MFTMKDFNILSSRKADVTFIFHVIKRVDMAVVVGGERKHDEIDRFSVSLQC
jgi:hypothetical protein